MSLTLTPGQSTAAASATPSLSDGAGAPEPQYPEFDIKPASKWVPVDWKELLHYRELLFFLVWRDVKVRYKQTVLGFAWAIIQPLTTMIIFTVIFGYLGGFKGKVPAELSHIPYPIFVYAGLLPWMYFSTGVSGGGMSLMSQQNLLTKVYFPRLFVPASVLGAALVDMGISFCVVFAMMIFCHVAVGWSILMLPVLILMTTLVALGMAFLLSSLTITYRDFRFLIPFMVQCWQFLSPVGYPLEFPKHPWINWVLRINPMYGIINGYRSALLGEHWDWAGMGMALGELLIILAFGVAYFKKTERRFADVA